MPEVADQICDGMFIPGVAVLLENRDRFGGPRNVIGFIRHAQFSMALSRSRPQRSSDCCEGLPVGKAQLFQFSIARNKHHSFGMPLRVCVPRFSKVNPEPATRSRTV